MFQELDKLIDADSSMSKDSSEQSLVQLFMIRNNDLSKGIIAAENDVASFLAFTIEANLL